MKLKFRADKIDIVKFIIFAVVLYLLVAEVVIQINSFSTTEEL